MVFQFLGTIFDKRNDTQSGEKLGVDILVTVVINAPPHPPPESGNDVFKTSK